MKKAICIIALAGLALVSAFIVFKTTRPADEKAPVAKAEPEKPPAAKPQPPATLTSEAILAAVRMAPENQDEALAKFSGAYSELARTLLEEFHSAKTMYHKSATIELMGLFRTLGTVEALAKNITFEYNSKKVIGKKELRTQYPAVYSLLVIGKRSTKFMIENIQTRDDALARRLSTDVIMQVEGVEVARFILESAMKKSTDDAGRKRLQEAIDSLAK